jgi:hypothetical protein
MRIIPVESVPLVERQHVREGIFRSRTLLTGTPGTPGNFSLQLVSLPGRYESPRHRHNFDQMRWQLEGDFDFSHDGRMRPGTLAYFPEGTRYGPQSSSAATTTLVLQFGGASGSGYISAEEYEGARTELSKSGAFAGGVYTRTQADGSKRNQDAYEAVWEQVNGRPLQYPEPRYARPVFMEPEHFTWVPQTDQPGTARKLLGVFSELGTRFALHRVEPGASLRLDDGSIYFMRAGEAAVNGTEVAAEAVVHVEHGESAVLEARTRTELLQIGLPRFGDRM